MRSLTQRATTALRLLCVLFALSVIAVGVTGVLGIGSAAHTGELIASDELLTTTTTAQAELAISAAYEGQQRALTSASAAERQELDGQLYTDLVPAADEAVSQLQALHADDPPAELADVDRFVSQWVSLRSLLEPARSTTTEASAADKLAVAYAPVQRHLSALVTKERVDAQDDQADSDHQRARVVAILGSVVAATLVLAVAVGWWGSRRVRRSLEPEQDLVQFADVLQLSENEEEAHLLLKRHLERAVPGASATVLNRNNSADRLQAVTPVATDSPLAAALTEAEPRSCVAVRSARGHDESADANNLLTCGICSTCPGNSTCTPLTVGGEVIGSVLLNRPSRFGRDERNRTVESVRQAAPVLANLRNLAIAELRAATDALTGLPNKRAVTDASKQMYAQAMRTQAQLSLILLDLDHFKAINDQQGHPVGDQALASVGAVLRGLVRATDFAGRNGGEEFALLLPDTSVIEAAEIAERIRESIAEISLPGVDVSVTASLGVAGFPEHAASLERLERHADAALYLAKRAGRNRVVVADPAVEMARKTPSGSGVA